MKARDVVLRLFERLPALTDKFTDNLNLTTLDAGGTTTATAKTATDHNLIVGDLVTITNAPAPVLIDTMDRVGTIVTVVTLADHDLTEGFQETVIIENALELEFNGTFKFITNPNRRTFTYETADSGPTSATGAPQLVNGSAFNYGGLRQVASIPDSTTFTFSLPKPISEPASGSPSTTLGYRISAVATAERAVDVYTKAAINDYWAFVVLGNVFASKSRENTNDAVATQGQNTEWKQQLIQPFSVYVFAPATAGLAARFTRDDMEDIALDLFQSLLGVKFDSGLTSGAYYRTVFDTHGIWRYDTAVYVHKFSFQTLADLTFGDTVGEDFSVAFRDIDFTMATDLMTRDTERLFSANDLDDDPLP